MLYLDSQKTGLPTSGTSKAISRWSTVGTCHHDPKILETLTTCNELSIIRIYSAEKKNSKKQQQIVDIWGWISSKWPAALFKNAQPISTYHPERPWDISQIWFKRALDSYSQNSTWTLHVKDLTVGINLNPDCNPSGISIKSMTLDSTVQLISSFLQRGNPHLALTSWMVSFPSTKGKCTCRWHPSKVILLFFVANK